jgi:diketogulonate reductase-like aldo/keto reductase
MTQAWGPLARAMRFNHETVQSIASKHGKDEAQVMLRWGLQHVSRPQRSCLYQTDKRQGYVVIPKSVSPKRIKSNSEVFDFELSSEEMKEVRMVCRL